MAKSAAASRAKKPDRRSLCEELLALRRKHADVYAQVDSLKAELIELATEAGDGFREIFANQGQVTVAGAKDKEFRGHVSEVDPKIFDALSEVKRQKLIDADIIKIVLTTAALFMGAST
jgi:hypothetical protein